VLSLFIASKMILQPEAAYMTRKNDHEQIFERPLSGELVTRLPPSLLPQRTAMEGRFVDLEPQDASKHAQELFEAGHGCEAALKIWDYLAYGPWPSIDAYSATLRQQSSSFDPIFYTIRSRTTGKACGQASFLDMHAQNSGPTCNEHVVRLRRFLLCSNTQWTILVIVVCNGAVIH